MIVSWKERFSLWIAHFLVANGKATEVFPGLVCGFRSVCVCVYL